MESYDDLLNFIKNNKDWLTLLKKDPYNLIIVQCPFKDKNNELLYPELFMLSYNIYTSDFTSNIVKASRGCIVSVEDINKPKMVCTPFHKFFNYGESNCATVDWKSTKVLEKLDGSLLKLFNYKNQWIWVTNNGWNIDTEIMEHLPCKYIEEDTDDLTTFEDFKNYALNNILTTKEYREAFDQLDKENTYMFELISPKNRIICEYPKTDLYFLAVRNKNTYEEFDAFTYAKNSILKLFKQPKVLNIKTLSDVLTLCDSYSTTDDEGVVVCDKNFNRFKIKCKHYLSIKYAKHNISLSNQKLLEAYLANDLDDAVRLFPELKQKILNIQEVYSKFYKKALYFKDLGSKKLQSFKDKYEAKLAKKLFVTWIFETYGKEKTFETTFLLMAEKNLDILTDVVNRVKYDKMLEWNNK